MISACCRLYGVSLVNKLQKIKDFKDISSKSFSDHYNTGIIIIVTMAL